jgi:CubicO group peptidase (beta-lactamase class C family)
MNFFRSIGGMIPLQILKNEPRQIEILWREAESDVVGKFTLDISEEIPLRIIKNTNFIVPAPAEFVPARVSEEAALVTLRSYVDKLYTKDKFSGAILIAKNDKTLMQEAWGKLSRKTGQAADVQTRYGFGSMGKMFTAIAILELVEAGKLTLDGVIADYIPDYPNKDVARNVTIRQLLTHTGGTGDIFGADFEENKNRLKDHSDYIAVFGKRPLTSELGKYKYSNYGYIILGAIIERLSGTSYYDYMDARIFKPAGMGATGYLPESTPVVGRAIGYTMNSGELRSNADLLPYRGTSAGGGYSTVGDLLRFAAALQEGRLISPTLLTEAIRNNENAYGYGLELHGDGETFFYGHSGSFPGMNGELRIYPRSGYVVIGLSNLDFPSVLRTLDHFTQRMPVN